MRVLALATNPATGASTRFRVLQWRPHLARAGFALELESFYSDRAAQRMYRPGRWPAKVADVAAGFARRSRTLRRLAAQADLLLIHREAYPLGIFGIERQLARFARPVVYDYDDAMFLPQREGRGILARLERLEAPARIMRQSAVALAGNRFLTDYARRHASLVVTLPTCVDTDRFRPATERAAARPVIGWVGSHSTARYLSVVRQTLAELALTRRFSVYVVGAGVRVAIKGVAVTQAPWQLGREAHDFAGCDIGVYPLTDEPWVQGKCGFKAIQFMACGVPVVASAIGANRDIIEDGVNGFLAASPTEWQEKLAALLSDEALRHKIGEAGRRTVEERYSVAAHASTLVRALREHAS